MIIKCNLLWLAVVVYFIGFCGGLLMTVVVIVVVVMVLFWVFCFAIGYGCHGVGGERDCGG